MTEIDRVAPEKEEQGMDDETQGGLLEAAWGIIANAWDGDWSKATPEWRQAAERWRDAYHAAFAGHRENHPLNVAAHDGQEPHYHDPRTGEQRIPGGSA